MTFEETEADLVSAEAEAVAQEPARRREPVAVASKPSPLVPMIIGAALFMQTLDATVISNALPAMARTLHEDPVTLNLAITAYMVATAVFLPLSAWIADRFGAKNVFRGAILGFALSSLLCGVAQTLPELIGARVLQGIAGALLMPVGRLVILRSVPKSQLVQAMSYLTMPALLGPIIGPPIGGFIVTYWSWRWVFFINLPMGALGLVLATLYIPDVREKVRDRLDLRGFILTACGLAGLVYGFDNLGRSVLPFTAVAGLLVGGAVCALLYGPHARRTPHAILDLSLFRIPTFSAATIGGLFSRLIIGAMPFLLALLLQLGFGLSPFAAGLLTFSGAVGALLMKTTARPIIRRFGFRTILVGNALIVAGITIGYGFFRSTTPHWILLVTLLVGGFLRSLQFTALNALAYADVPHARMSRASSLASMIQQLAQSLGIGIAAILIRAGMAWNHSGAVATADISPAFIVVALLSLVALVFYLPLGRDAGAEVSGRLVAGDE